MYQTQEMDEATVENGGSQVGRINCVRAELLIWRSQLRSVFETVVDLQGFHDLLH
jgi:hypothetical protein